MIDGVLKTIDPVDRIKRDKTDFYLKIEGIKKGENASLEARILSRDNQFRVFPDSESTQERRLTFVVRIFQHKEFNLCVRYQNKKPRAIFGRCLRRLQRI